MWWKIKIWNLFPKAQWSLFWSDFINGKKRYECSRLWNLRYWYIPGIGWGAAVAVAKGGTLYGYPKGAINFNGAMATELLYLQINEQGGVDKRKELSQDGEWAKLGKNRCASALFSKDLTMKSLSARCIFMNSFYCTSTSTLYTVCIKKLMKRFQ